MAVKNIPDATENLVRHRSDEEVLSPRGAPLDEEKTHKRSASIDHDPLMHLQVLYVEDGKLQQSAMRIAGMKFKWSLDIVATCEEALRKVKDAHYDLVLMDCNLGSDQIDGYETTRKIKAVTSTLLVISFSTEPLDKKQKEGPEMDGHIQKNTSPSKLRKNLKPFFFPKGKVSELVQKSK